MLWASSSTRTPLPLPAVRTPARHSPRSSWKASRATAARCSWIVCQGDVATAVKFARRPRGTAGHLSSAIPSWRCVLAARASGRAPRIFAGSARVAAGPHQRRSGILSSPRTAAIPRTDRAVSAWDEAWPHPAIQNVVVLHRQPAPPSPVDIRKYATTVSPTVRMRRPMLARSHGPADMLTPPTRPVYRKARASSTHRRIPRRHLRPTSGLRPEEELRCTVISLGPGHSYVVYARSPTAPRSQYEGAPTGVQIGSEVSLATRNHLYNGADRIRAFMRGAGMAGEARPEPLRCRSVGEPITRRPDVVPGAHRRGHCPSSHVWQPETAPSYLPAWLTHTTPAR